MLKTAPALCSLVLLGVLSLGAQDKNEFILNRYTPDITFIRMDSTHTSQTTVIEYTDFLVLSELPFIDEGAGKKTDLSEDIPRAERFIQFVKKEFGGKPIKYVVSSHWHLHSLSAITPFFREGARLLTTKKNWQYSIDNGFLGSHHAGDFASNVIEIMRDTTILSETTFPIQVIYLDSTYKNKPTEDYLFLYFPAIKTLHASCMCALVDVDFSKKKDIVYSDRLTDLHEAIRSRNLPVDNIIKLGRFEQAPGKYLPPLFSRAYLNDYMKNGIAMHQAVKQYTDMDLQVLSEQKDNVVLDAIQKSLSPQIINQAAYDCIRRKDFKKAVALAQIVNLYSPGELNYVDTMGEAYFASGDIATASYYDAILKKKDPKFGGGMKTWEHNQKNQSY